MVAPVEINGKASFDFLIDTGTNTCLLDTRLAQELALRPIDRVWLNTVGGSQALPRSQVQSLALGQRALENVEILWSDLRQIRSLDSRIRGVLGQNFLSQFNYLVDYRSRSIVFEEGSNLEDRMVGTRFPIERNEGKLQLLIQSSSSRNRALHFVLDSGIEGLVLFGSASRELDIDNQDLWVKASTDVGTSSIETGRIRALHLGTETLFGLPVTLLPDAKLQGRVEDGLLPASLFHSIYVNNSRNFVILNPSVRR